MTPQLQVNETSQDDIELQMKTKKQEKVPVRKDFEGPWFKRLFSTGPMTDDGLSEELSDEVSEESEHRYYDTIIYLILIATIIFGATSSLAVKTLFQTGLEDPFYVSCLALLGRGFSIAVHYGGLLFKQPSKEEQAPEPEQEQAAEQAPAARPTLNRMKSASERWLTEESEQIAELSRQMPMYMRPVIPAIMGLSSNLLGSVSLLLVPTYLSVTFLSAGGLVASLFAAKYVRKREVPMIRWQGGGIVVVGLLAVAGSAFLEEEAEESGSSVSMLAGIAALVAAIVTKTMRNLSQEIFLQETDFPAFLLLGLEGAYGLVISLPIYALIGPLLGHSIVDTFSTVAESSTMILLSILLVPLFLLNSGFSIWAIDLTSAASRGLWKAPTGLVAWLGSVILFYSTGQDQYGNGWSTASSLIMFVGYIITFMGIYRYYQIPVKQMHEV